MKKIITTNKAPKAIATYSQAVEINGFLYISGQIAIDPETGTMVEGGIQEQTERVLKNIKGILDDSGYSLQNVVKTTCILSDIGNYKQMNEVYVNYFNHESPARAAYAVSSLPMNALIEIEAIAYK